MPKLFNEKGGDWLNPKIAVRKTRSSGKGMFAQKQIRKGETIMIWRGGIYTNKKGAIKAKKAGKVVMQWDDNLFSIEESSGDLAYYNDLCYYINHSCDGNVWMTDAFTFVAKRHIKIGEEVTVDYAIFEANKNYVAEWKCNCGSTVCRKIITGNDWKLPEVQKLYKNHFSPLINKRIKKRAAR